MRSKKYEYEPLPSPSHIRLIKVEAAAALDPIHCSIKMVDLNDKPAFLALSYSWKQDKSLGSLLSKPGQFLDQYGKWVETQNKNTKMGQRDPVSIEEHGIKKREVIQELLKESSASEPWISSTIFCDGKSKTIGPNLYSALLHLRKHRPGYYWIDAVCINQDDLLEQSAQVQIMGRIYSSAAEVIVWLGDVPLMLDSGMQQLSGKLATLSGTTPLSFSNKDMDKFDEIVFQVAMAWLVTRRWFRRLWVVQESCLARQMTFVTGDYDFRPESFSRVIEWLENLSPEKTLGWFTMLSSAWATQIKRIPAMLASNEFFQSGGLWTLRDWLDATTARKARNTVDIVFAGLALVDGQSLIIDQDLQLREERSGLQPPHQRLWQVLHADYTAEPPFVLLNLAACILSHWDFNTLFAITLRFRPPPTTGMSKALLLPQASWIPDPIPWSLQELQPGFMLNNPKRPLPVSKDLENPRPRISADGTTLFMNAVNLDEITQCLSLTGFMPTTDHDNDPKTMDIIDWIAQFLPRVYHTTDKQGLRTFVKVAMSKYRMQREPMADTVETFMYWLFCDFVDTWLQGRISLEKISKEERQKEDQMKRPKKMKKEKQEEDLYSVPGVLTFVGASVPGSSNVHHSETASRAHAELKKSHPDAPWPENLKKLKASRTRDSSGEQPPEFSQELLDFGKELSGLNANEDKPYAKVLKHFSKSLHVDIVRHYMEDLRLQSIFITKQGYMGIGPAGLQIGDCVFLIADGKAPYIFTHIDNVLQRRAAQIRLEIGIQVDAASEVDLRKDLVEVGARIGKQDGYQLVGEAYIEGVMNGEVADQLKDRTKRYSFL
jgi:hypothetical protein